MARWNEGQGEAVWVEASLEKWASLGQSLQLQWGNTEACDVATVALACSAWCPSKLKGRRTGARKAIEGNDSCVASGEADARCFFKVNFMPNLEPECTTPETSRDLEIMCSKGPVSSLPHTHNPQETESRVPGCELEIAGGTERGLRFLAVVKCCQKFLP